MLVQEWDLEKAIAFERRDAWMEGRTEGRTEGRMEGWTEGRMEGWTKGQMAIARKMKDKGKSVGEIAEMTDLTVDDILRL